jgi:hypothetical protein
MEKDNKKALFLQRFVALIIDVIIILVISSIISIPLINQEKNSKYTEKLSEIQHELKAPKGQYNSFGKYKYRSCEDILEAVKPLCYKHKTTLVLGDSIVFSENGRFYVKATATLYDQESEQIVQNDAFARESEEKKGMDDSQITGTASSYARKYALNGLFNIDDTKDADTDEYTKQVEEAGNKIIDDTKIEAMTNYIKKEKLEEKRVLGILAKYGYNNLTEIKVKDYVKIGKELEALTKEA